MGTGNFSPTKNTSAVYAVLMNREVDCMVCQECGDIHHEWEHDLDKLTQCAQCDSENLERETQTEYPDEWDRDDLVNEIVDSISESGGRTYDNRDNRVGELHAYENFAGAEVSIQAVITIESGYYEGAQLDFLMMGNIDCQDFYLSTGSHYDTDLDEFCKSALETIQYDNDYSDEEMECINEQLTEWVHQTYDELRQKADELLARYAEYKLQVSARFSNGETWYTKIGE